MILTENDLEFDFTDAVSAIKFDDTDHALAHCMKAVDFVVEFPEAWLFVEVKDPSNPRAHIQATNGFREGATSGKLCRDIVRKFRDSFIYRWAEENTEKPIHFIFLITIEEALLNSFQDELRRDLPLTGPLRWSRQIVESCHALSIEAWNRNFSKWPVRRLSDVV